MKTLFILIVLIALSGCRENEPLAPSASLDRITLSTDKIEYTAPDSIFLYLQNKSNVRIILGFRCDYRNLEMYYQEYINTWSENKWFDYMSLLCPTIMMTLPAGNTYTHSLPGQKFDTSGTFRLEVPVYIPDKDSTVMVRSNSFEIN